MPIDNFTLNDFVCPIPICQPEADLGSILNIFRHLNCKSLVIPRDNGKWGIINSEDLLSLIAQVWSQKKTAVVSHPKVRYGENTPNLSAEDFDSIIRPAIIYQSDTELPKFLSYLQQDFLSNARHECLIINPAGKLQGRLNTDKMLKYLAAELNQSSANTVESTSKTSFPSLIDAISLPLKLETVAGENLYHNQCWQELIVSSTDASSQPKTDTSIANWWMEQQLSWEQNRAGKQHPEHDGDISSIDVIPSTTPLGSQPSDKLVPGHLDQTNSPFRIQIEQSRDWNYIKIPLTWTKKLVFNGDISSCWLVLATKLPVENLRDLSSNLPPTKTMTARLLGTVAHELKSPLTGIIGLSSLLEGEKLGKLNQRQARYVELITNSGGKIMSVVKDLVELTSFTAEQSQLKPESINLPSLCQQTYQQVLTELQLLDQTEHDSPVAIESEAETAIADRAHLSKILAHLIAETIQFSKAEATLSIKIKDLSKSVAIEIANNSDREPLSASESTAAHTGLNLIIAKYLAEILQGKITSVYWADSCQFTLTLPQNDSSSTRLTPKLETLAVKNVRQNLTILCLDPEPEVIDPQKYSSDLDLELKNWSSHSEQQLGERYRVIEADGLEQADILARIWQLDVVVLNSYQISNPSQYLRSLQKSKRLSALPLITLDTRTTEAANQISGLRVYPCLLPAKHRSLQNLLRVIQIATGSEQRTTDHA
ncbi:HAMP domain-containing histidine kinase [Pleurocapsales cyanobacterium LEGE 10410]|nr:HAMP domain-containing histidine kinase [Pleurocapsales cyanobacterium LEGE 10410]